MNGHASPEEPLASAHGKRKSEVEDGAGGGAQPAHRTKRNRYIAIAWYVSCLNLQCVIGRKKRGSKDGMIG